METRSVLLISGGLDSIGSFLKLARDPMYAFKNVRLFHVEFRSNLMWKPQREVLRSLLSVYKRYDLYTYRTENMAMKDPLEVAMKAMLVFGTGNFRDGFLAGENPTELELIVGYELDESGLETTLEELNDAIQMMRQAFIRSGIGILPVRVTSVVSDMTKGEIKEMIGEIPFWSCRFPNIRDQHTYFGCGECGGCKDLAKYGIKHPVVYPTYSLMCEKGGL